MGVSVSHGCWQGAGSAFTRWRKKLAEVAGFPPLEKMNGYEHHSPECDRVADRDDECICGANDNQIQWDTYLYDPLSILLNHPDDAGKIDPCDCASLAERLEGLLPLLPNEDDKGSIGNWHAKTATFIDGLWRAATLGEHVRFR